MKKLNLPTTAAILVLFSQTFAGGCLKIRQPPTPPAPDYMNTSDNYKILDVEATNEPTAYFVLNGKPFCFAGTNNYYFTYKSKAMVDDVMAHAESMGLNVIRMHGFIDMGSLDDSVPSVDRWGSEVGTKDGRYFQYWDKTTNAVAWNEGPNGLQQLDYAIHAARQHGLKVLIDLTNNWREFGGMDQYVTWAGLKYHHEFYTDERARVLYRNWVSKLVNRVNSVDGTLFRDDPAIFAWELANEPRCRNGEEMDAAPGEGCNSTTIATWIDEMSTYIKSVDPNHMVAVGDEGFLVDDVNHWSHKGEAGTNHEQFCGVRNIDFCTVHMYPDDWGTGIQFGYDWVTDHIDVARRLGKPTVFEEYGTHVRRDQQSNKVIWGWERRKTAYTNWVNLMKQRGANGFLFWMLSGKDDQQGIVPDYDHYQVYEGDQSGELLVGLVADFKQNARACVLAGDATEGVPSSPFVSAIFTPTSN